MDEKQENNSPRRALIVDDSEVNRKILSCYLQHLGYRIMMAEDGKQGIVQFELHKPDVVFLDIVMPKMNGLDILKKMTQIDHKCIIIIISSFVTQENIQKAKDFGADWFLVKPFTEEKVAETIAKFEYKLQE